MQPKQITGSTTFNLELDEGMDYTFKFVYVDDSTLLPINLTGYRADLYVRSTPGSAQVLKGISTSFTYPDGSISLGALGQITLNIASTFTFGQMWDNGFYDLVLTSPDQKSVKLLKGRLNIYNTLAFPLTYSPNPVPGALMLTSGKTTLPNGIDLYGYMNPLKLGVGGGLLFTGRLIPAFYMGQEIVELSYSGGVLRLTFAGNMPSTNVSVLHLGTTMFDTEDSQGIVYNANAAAGLGLTFWEWRDVDNPFGDVEGVAVLVSIDPEVQTSVIDGGSF